MSATAAERLHRDAFVLDTHVHAPGFVPQPFAGIYRFVNRATMPPDVGLPALGDAGVDCVVAKAVGDPVVTRWYRGGPWRAVNVQLDDIERQAAAAGARIVREVSDLDGDGLGVILGVEGGDFLGGETARLDDVHRRGVRVLVIVHMADNHLGTTCLPWHGYIGRFPVRRRRTPGLTPTGAAVVRRMNELGVLVDLAHADTATLRGAVEVTNRPVVSSHSGARVLDDFARFLSDDEIRAIASTGGVIGLWPFRHRGHGVADVRALVAHARHVAEVTAPEHLCIGTDMNGVPGVMQGYRGEQDLPLVTAALLEGGFAEADVRGILGDNVRRVLKEVWTP